MKKYIQILRKSIHAALQKVLGSEKVDKIFNGKDPNKQMILLRKKRPDLFARRFSQGNKTGFVTYELFLLFEIIFK